MTKKGSISIEMIILIILALITLVVVAAYFTGGMQQLFNKITGISSAIPEADRLAAKTTCDQYCAANSNVYCSPSFAGTLAGKKCSDFTTCSTVTC